MPSNAKGQKPYGKTKCIGPKECFVPALQNLEKFIPIDTQGKWKQKQIHTCSLGMAAERLSIHSVQDMVKNIPTETPLRNHLAKLRIDELLDINHLLLTNKLLDGIPRDIPIRLAFDETDDPYYGEITEENEEYVIGSKVKRSTTTFYRYHTLYLILGDWKITLYVIPVKKGSSKLDHIKQMIEIIEDFGFIIEVLLLDRGYYSKEVFRYLMSKEIPHIMPVKEHSAEMKRVLRGRRSRSTKYTMTPATDPLELDLAINVTYSMGRYDKNVACNKGYFYYNLDWKPNKIASVYRRRFGIEASYRMRNFVRVKTTSKSPTIRYYFALVSMLLKNVWVLLRWRFFPEKRRGPRRVDEDAFRFDRFRMFVWKAFERIFGVIRKIPTNVPAG